MARPIARPIVKDWPSRPNRASGFNCHDRGSTASRPGCTPNYPAPLLLSPNCHASKRLNGPDRVELGRPQKEKIMAVTAAKPNAASARYTTGPARICSTRDWLILLSRTKSAATYTATTISSADRDQDRKCVKMCERTNKSAMHATRRNGAPNTRANNPKPRVNSNHSPE